MKKTQFITVVLFIVLSNLSTFGVTSLLFTTGIAQAKLNDWAMSDKERLELAQLDTAKVIADTFK